MTPLAFLVGVCAFALFGLASDQHHARRFRRPCPRPRARTLRAAAWACLAIGFALSLQVWGPVFGPIGWCATMMAGAAVAFCGLNFVPTRR